MTVRMSKSDVLVEEVEPDLCDCGEPVTHSVNLDLRAIGMGVSVELCCRSCAYTPSGCATACRPTRTSTSRTRTSSTTRS